MNRRQLANELIRRRIEVPVDAARDRHGPIRQWQHRVDACRLDALGCEIVRGPF